MNRGTRPLEGFHKIRSTFHPALLRSLKRSKKSVLNERAVFIMGDLGQECIRLAVDGEVEDGRITDYRLKDNMVWVMIGCERRESKAFVFNHRRIFIEHTVAVRVEV